MKTKDLIGKTIVKATFKKLKEFDDSGFLELKFSDKTSILIVAGYGGYTGESEDEYPTLIAVIDDMRYYKGKLINYSEK